MSEHPPPPRPTTLPNPVDSWRGAEPSTSDRQILTRIWWSVWALGLLNLAALLAVLLVVADA